MRVLTKQEVLEGVAKHWKQQHYRKQDYHWYSPRHKDVYDQLVFVKTKEEIDAVIGGSGWTHLLCNECGQDVDRVVVLQKEEDDYGGTESYYCLGCICSSLELLNKENS